jgi:transcriptional regulator with XRE-family HTH domain
VSDGKSDPAAARFAENIRARRELNGLSQQDLAQAVRDLGHTSFRQQTIAEIENCNRQVKLDEALSLSRVLGATIDHLVRPAGLTAQASELLDAARELRNAARQAAHWAGESKAARRRVNKAISTATKNELVLADEMAIARRTLAETED